MTTPIGSDDPLLRLFQREMAALDREGQVFSVDHPESAWLLDPARVDDPDPYVDRLIEGFAYLAARTRQAAKAQGGGLVDPLRELFEDGLERPLPSVVVVEAALREPSHAPVLLRQGHAFRSAGANLGHRFELGGDLWIDTVEIVEARVESGAKNSQLDLKLRRRDGEAGRWPDPFSVFLHGDAAVVWSLRHALTRKVSRIEVPGPSGWVEASSVRVAKASSPGYAGDPRVHPLADARDFLCCDARFRFVEVAGLGALADGSELSLRIHFDGIFPRSEAKGVRAEVFRPNAGLVVNRFSATCDGMVWDHTRSEMPLHPGKSREILDVVGVEGVVRGDPAGRIRYARFPRCDGRTDFGTFFQVRRAADPREREAVLLALGREDLDDPLQEQCVVVEAICCDGDRPHENGAVGELSSVDPGAAPGVRMAGLTRPTPAYRPRSEVLERLMALAGGHFEGFLDADRLREALDLFLWDRTEVKRTLVDSIQSVVVESGYAVEHGVTLPEFRVKIQLRDTACTADAWDRLGLLDAFSDVLALLAADEAPLGAITRLDVAIEPCGIVLDSSRA